MWMSLGIVIVVVVFSDTNEYTSKPWCQCEFDVRWQSLALSHNHQSDMMRVASEHFLKVKAPLSIQCFCVDVVLVSCAMLMHVSSNNGCQWLVGRLNLCSFTHMWYHWWHRKFITMRPNCFSFFVFATHCSLNIKKKEKNVARVGWLPIFMRTHLFVYVVQCTLYLSTWRQHMLCDVTCGCKWRAKSAR